MTYTAKDLYRIMDGVDHHARAVQKHLVELRAALATFDLPQSEPPFACPVASCGLRKKTRQLLDEHLEHVHGIEPKQAA